MNIYTIIFPRSKVKEVIEAETLTTNDDGSHKLLTNHGEGKGWELVAVIPSQAFITVKEKEQIS